MWQSVRLFGAAVSFSLSASAADTWLPANDTRAVARSGDWQWRSHRYAAESALVTTAEDAALEVDFRGRALVLCLDTLTPSNYGPPELGALDVFVDGAKRQTVRPRVDANEVVIARANADESHRVRIVHRRDDGGIGCRIRGFRVVSAPTGDLVFTVNAEQNGALIDVRATVTERGQVVRDALVRNWLTGQCRLAGLPPGNSYALELRAAGWKTARIAAISIVAGVETPLPPIYLAREGDTSPDDFKFPGPGRPVVVRPGETFRTRLEANQAEIRAVRLVRQQSPATISRAGAFAEDKAAAFYYHREGTVTVPGDTPPGVYDLEVTIVAGNGARTLVSRRSVVVVEKFPRDPVFVAFGHLDTWGQHQAEYLQRLVTLSNLLAPDLVLDSNEANAAYAAGALYGLEVPYVINFGNHRAPEPGPWFGEPIGIVDFGAELTVLNFGRAWDTDTAEADKLFSARARTRTKVINAFESNAPVREFLDRHGVALIHYAHGPGPAVATMGATPTIRVGKVNSESFRVIRFKDGRPVSYTYRGHATAALPFPRSAPPPIRLSYEPANDGTHREITARWHNDLEEAFPQARAVFVLPRGNYRVNGGRAEFAATGDDGKFTVLAVRFDLAAKGYGEVSVAP